MLRSLSIIASLLSAGCALQTEHINLTYRSAAPAQPLQDAAGKLVSVTAREGRTGDPQIVSVKKNSYGMELGDLVANQPVLPLVQNAVSTELAARGFVLAPGGADVQLELEHFFADYKNGFFTVSNAANISFLAQVRTPTGPVLYTRVINATARPDGSILGTPSLARESLDAALQQGVSTLIEDPAFLTALEQASASPHTASVTINGS